MKEKLNKIKEECKNYWDEHWPEIVWFAIMGFIGGRIYDKGYHRGYKKGLDHGCIAGRTDAMAEVAEFILKNAKVEEI